MSTTTYTFDRFEIRKDTALWGVLLLNTELLLILAYLFLGSSRVTGFSVVLIPFLWINLSIWVLARTEVPSVTSAPRA